jgi:hypothetical protein
MLLVYYQKMDQSLLLSLLRDPNILLILIVGEIFSFRELRKKRDLPC